MGKRKEHWKKEEAIKNETKILKLLESKDMRFGELEQVLSDLSPTTITRHLEKLLRKKIISRYWNEDKRANFYRVDPESKDQVTGTLAKYEALKFIKSIPRLAYYNPSIKSKQNMAAFASVPSTVNRDSWIEDWKKRVDRVNRITPKFPGVGKGEKMAIVIMVEG
jgi:DNA-binding transcriptional ArsR family regulator